MSRSFVRLLALALFFLICPLHPSALAAQTEDPKEKRKTSFLEDLITFPLSSTQELQKVLEDNIFNLGEVNISSARVSSRMGDRPATDVPHNITVIGSKQIEQSSAVSTAELVRLNEGVTYTDETGQGLNARVDLRGFGGEAKQALVLFDGLRAVEPFDNSVVWHLYPRQFLRQIEIERGGGSTVYGEGALSGVIQMKTKGPTEKLHLTTENSWGSFSDETYFADASGTAAGIGFYAGGHYRSTEGYRQNGGHEGASTLWKGEINPGDLLKIENAFYFADNETGIPGPLTRAEADFNRRQKDPDGQYGDQFSDKLVQDSLQTSLYVDKLGVELTNLFGYRLRNQDSVQTFGGLFGGTSTNEIETETFSDVVQGAWSFEKGIFASSLVVGAEWSKDDIYNPFEFLSGFGPFGAERAIDRQMVGVFAQHHAEFWERFITQIGVRWDQIDWDIYDLKVPELQKRKEATHVSPAAGAEFKIFDPLAVYASYAESFKTPDSNTLIFETPNLFTPNPNIDPQVARHNEVGLRYAHPVFGSVRTDYFYIETKKEILFNDITNLNENFDTIRQGVEVATETAITPEFQVFANYTYTNAEFDHSAFDQKTIPLVPESKWSLGFLAQFLQGWTLSAQATGYYDQFALNDFNNIFPMDDYWTLDGRLAYKYKNWEVFTAVQNVLDEEYDSFVTSNGVNTVNFNPAAGTAFQIGFKAEI